MLHRPGKNKGTAATEWAILAALVSVTAIAATTRLGELAPHAFERYAQGPDNPDSSAPSETEALLSEDGCFRGTINDDDISLHPGLDCYRLGAGDDDFSGAASAAPLFVDAGSGRGGFTLIATGSGNDHVVSAQSGRVTTGAGNDLIELDLPDRSRFELDPGPGDDQLTLDAGAPPAGAPANRILSGQGHLSATLSCKGGPVVFELAQESESNLSGDCAIDARTDSGAGRRTLTARVSEFTGRFDAADHLILDIETPLEQPAPRAQGLYIPHWEAGKITYRTSSLTQADFSLSNQTGSAGGTVEVSIQAPVGIVSLEGAGQPDWQIHALYTEGGQVTLAFPDEDGFYQMRAPRLSGRAETLRISGCFDQLRLLRGSTEVWSADPCLQGNATTHSIDSSDDDLALELARGGEHQLIPLGAGDLAINRVIISR